MGRVTITTWGRKLTRMTGKASMARIVVHTRMPSVTSLGIRPVIGRMARLSRMTRITRRPMLTRLGKLGRIPSMLSRIMRQILLGRLGWKV